MEIINNIDNLLGENLKLEVRKGSKVSIAASCFSIYAYEALMKELNQVEEVRFIFTSPTFIADSIKKGEAGILYPETEPGKKLVRHRI